MNTVTNQQSAPSLQDQVKQRLRDRGLLKEIRPLPANASHDSWQPIPVEGTPVSELIIAERR